MRRLLKLNGAKLALSATALAVLAGCTSASLEQNISRTNDEASSFTDQKLSLARTEPERKERADAAQNLLAKPLGQREAVQLALVNSPDLQALLAQNWAESANAAQIGRIANPFLSYKRLTSGDDVDVERTLTIGLLDVLTLPMRQGVSRYRIEQSQLRLTSEVVDQVTQVRQAWVRAVAAQQTLRYARQVYESAQASAEIARRMQAAGNFNRISRAREQAFYADAATQLATSTHEVTATREELIRRLGLNEAQASQLRLPERLPDLPKQAMDPQTAASYATRNRLDIRLAQLNFEAYAKSQGLTNVTSFTDIELTAQHNTSTDGATGNRTDFRGFEVGVRLPIFDWGGMQRDAMNARTLAAANQLEATVRSAGSSLRESYSAYRTAFDVARHQRDEVVPLRKVISEENQLRYNGMLIGIFELLADARDQVNTVLAAINTEQQFWLADAALQATLIGRPTSTTLSAVASPSGASAAGH